MGQEAGLTGKKSGAGREDHTGEFCDCVMLQYERFDLSKIQKRSEHPINPGKFQKVSFGNGPFLSLNPLASIQKLLAIDCY